MLNLLAVRFSEMWGPGHFPNRWCKSANKQFSSISTISQNPSRTKENPFSVGENVFDDF